MTAIEIQSHIDHVNSLLLNSDNQSYSLNPSDGGTGRSANKYNRTELLKELVMWKRALAKVNGACSIVHCKAAF